MHCLSPHQSSLPFQLSLVIILLPNSLLSLLRFSSPSSTLASLGVTAGLRWNHHHHHHHLPPSHQSVNWIHSRDPTGGDAEVEEWNQVEEAAHKKWCVYALVLSVNAGWYQRCLLAMLMPRLPMLTLSRIWSGRIFLGQTCLAWSFTRLLHLLRDVPKSFASFFNNFCIYKRVDVFSGHNTGNGTSTPKPSGMLLTPKVQLTQKLKKNTFLFHY